MRRTPIGPLLRFCLKAGASGLLLWLLLRNHDLGAIAAAISKADPWTLALAALCHWCVALPSALRWSKVIESMGHRLDFRLALSFVLIGYFFNLVLPTSVGGDGMRMWKAYRSEVPGPVAIVSVMVDRAMQFAAHLLLIVAAFPLVVLMVPDWRVRAAAGILILGGIGALCAVASIDFWPRPFRQLPLVGRAAPLAVGLRGVLFVPGRAALAVALGLANQVTIVVVVGILATSLGLPITWTQIFIAVPIAVLATILPSIGGWGVREAGFVGTFALLGVPTGAALALSVLFGLVTFVVRLPGGVVWLAVGRSRQATIDIEPAPVPGRSP